MKTLFMETTKIEPEQTAAEIQQSWLDDKNSIGITAGASTAEDTVNEVLRRLKE